MSKDSLIRLLENTESLDGIQILHINNVVSTVKLLNDNETLCLENLAAQLNGELIVSLRFAHSRLHRVG